MLIFFYNYYYYDIFFKKKELFIQNTKKLLEYKVISMIALLINLLENLLLPDKNNKNSENL